MKVLNIGTEDNFKLFEGNEDYIIDHQFYNETEAWLDEEGNDLKEPDYRHLTAKDMDSLWLSFYPKYNNHFKFEDKIINSILISDLRCKENSKPNVVVTLQGDNNEYPVELSQKSIALINTHFKSIGCEFKMNDNLTFINN